METKITYSCIFDKEKDCLVKQEYKLRPESLVEFCKICKVPDSNKRKMEFETTIQLISQMSNMQHELGEFKAKAELYQKLYEELKGVPSKND